MDNRPTIAEVQEWVLKLYNTCEQTITSEERKEQHKYAVMVQRPQDKKFLVKMLDESSQIRDRKKLAERIKKLIDRYGVPEFLNKRMLSFLKCTRLLATILILLPYQS